MPLIDSRAGLLAAPAAQAGVEGEQLLGCEFGHLADAQDLGLFDILDLVQLAGRRCAGAARYSAGCCTRWRSLVKGMLASKVSPRAACDPEQL